MRPIWTWLVCMLASSCAWAQNGAAQLAVYPAPAGIASNDGFTVKVRSPGGPWRELFCYQVEVDMHKPRPSSMAYFDFSGSVEITWSKNIEIDGITVINSTHYTVYGGQSQNITIRNFKAFSSRGWSDGIDLMSCSDVLADGVFMWNSDDCIAIYGHRWGFYGDARNITVRNSSLWADVAHPIMIGTHGNPAKPEMIENLTFSNIDILNHDEPQIAYQGCVAMNASDENLIRNVRAEDLRIEDFEQGQLVNLRVTTGSTPPPQAGGSRTSCSRTSPTPAPRPTSRSSAATTKLAGSGTLSLRISRSTGSACRTA